MRRTTVTFSTLVQKLSHLSKPHDLSDPDARIDGADAWKTTKSTTKEKAPSNTIGRHVPKLEPGGTAGEIARTVGGIDFDPNEHPLLAELDDQRDALMYGTGKDFYENVKRVRTIVLTHHKWELGESMYKALLLVVQVLCLTVVYNVWAQYQTLELLISSREDFAQIVASRIREMEAQRVADGERCVHIVRHGGSTTPQQIEDTAIQLRRVLLPTSEDYHAIVRKRMKKYFEEKHAALRFPD